MGCALFEGRGGWFEVGDGGREVGREEGESAVVVGEDEGSDES